MSAPQQVIAQPEKAPVKEVVQLPKLEVKLEDPTQLADSTSVPTPPLPKNEKAVTGNKQDWLRSAGIPEADWQYVDFIVSRESSWNPNAKNASSGACGLAQALPCSKLGPNWNDPVTALKWQHAYVSSRYGGYKQAYAFWQANHWY